MKAGLDIGNTKSKLGLFMPDGRVEMETIDRSPQALHDKVQEYKIKDLIVTSVTQLLVEDEEVIRNLDSFIWLSDSTPLPISLAYLTPETLGRDRIATAVGASVLKPNEHSIIVDAGTCMTVDLLKKGKIFEGGYIAPGINMRWKAMNEYTANLPLVQNHEIRHIIGKSTHEALSIGGAMATVMELEGFLHRIKTELNPINVILTGGDGTFIADHIVSDVNHVPSLLMIGLREIQRYNAN